MSGFIVHGIMRSAILASAKKKTEPLFQDQRGKPLRRMTPAEWEFAVGVRAAFDLRKAKPQPISPRYDAPAFAKRFIDIALSGGNLVKAQIMAWTPTQQIDPKTRQPVFEWRPYTGPMG